LVVIKDIQTLLVDVPKIEPKVETESASTSTPVPEGTDSENTVEETEDIESTESTEEVAQ